ncbi:CRISPR-associated endonuclease Cas6 [Terrisporobacter mayombei]|uniref:DNA repair protein n=1 Tax=Terrisporobacter mayombei TaxID=1541 RepID=A0ABY9PWM1_9FIRM|nr:CRISPR-associated endonuclease Cas6 [Terrisporobacter mayombei]MCC3867942.1 DNA repair protein [Terrisporobacter mayombei]WMT80076.1 hypothetical protein TEMA_03650 [Terrisporobacter mayombei]
MDLNVCRLELLNVKMKQRDSEKMRGYLGNKYEELDILHNHKDDKFIYRYPKVQYKVINEKPIILGIDEGANVITNIGFKDDELVIGEKSINTFEKKISISNDEYGVTKDYIKYKFLSPWIALNQKNVNNYINSNEMDQEEILKKILIGNIISMSKGLNYTVEDKVKCWINLDKIQVNIKDIKHIGFVGEFKVNFNIPDYFGIGKNVSKGFGTIKRVR